MTRAMIMAVLLAGCAAHPAQPPKFECDDHGLIVETADLTPDQQVEAIHRNVQLLALRGRATAGERWIDADRLDKAEGCP